MVARFRSSQLKPISDMDAAWLAGLLEGEGSFLCLERRGVKRLVVSMQIADADIIDRVVEITGVGVLTTITRPNRKVVYGWAVNPMNDARPLMLRLHPFMGARRRGQIEAALAAVDSDMADRRERGMVA